jgi:phosphoglycerate dehydrogenase-like enzyme
MAAHDVVLVGSLDYYFNPVTEAVIAKGHNVVRYNMPADFAAKPDALDNASVLYAVGYCPVSREVMARAPHLRAVISPWTGTEGFDERAASELGIIVGNGKVPENADGMAEATVLMILACLYDFNTTQQRFRTQEVWAIPQLTARQLKGKTIGLLGYGEIARGVVDRLAAWGVTFCATTRTPPAENPHGIAFLPLEEMLAASDIVCVLAPLTEQTRGMLSAARLKLMKRGSILVCTSRGGIIDEEALVRLDQEGHFNAIGLDVFEKEPLPKDSPLRGLKNAVLTPHSIGLTREMRVKSVEASVANVLRVLEGEAPLYIRNPQILDAWRARWAGQRSEA